MNRIILPGSFCECLPDESFAIVQPTGVQTHEGFFPAPLGLPLYVRVSKVGGFKFAGQGSAGGTVLWKGDWYLLEEIATGQSGCIFDRDGVLQIIQPGEGVTSQGYRYVAPDGRLVRGDETYGPLHGLTEYTDLSDAQDRSFLIGQGEPGGGIRVWYDHILRELEPGNCTFVRANRDGDRLAIACRKPEGAYLCWLTVAELWALPPVVPEEPKPGPKPQPKPEKPVYQRISPDYSAHVAKCAEMFPAAWDRANKEKHGSRTDEFIRLCASYIHDKVDPKVGNNGKRGGDELSADALAYLNASAPGGAEVIDVIVGAGHKPTWSDATIPPMPHPQGRADVPEGVLGKFIAPAPFVDGGDPGDENDARKPHPYEAGEHDGGTCDICGQPRSAAIHQVVQPGPVPSGSGLDATVQRMIAAAVAPLSAKIAALEARPTGGGGGSFPSKIALKTAHGKYLSAQDDGSVVADREHVGAWETFNTEAQE